MNHSAGILIPYFAASAGVVGIGLYAVGADKKTYSTNATIDTAGPTDWGKVHLDSSNQIL